ncbi:MAG: SgcJ/EcaC family oxidoreductase [Pseudonocardia sp.]|uniref:SgcJ/EcaC family oxidoreductase n=1 Tax=unclassified Pseudonocardia TaxID=2619320 RepID=UPI00086F99DF|nr:MULTISPECIES: SgcJ/EcaC family oxidoreductase [unclassified Pseudonocardia]MBN9111141.1 SgcJ/EcaC family oxidoreductase [Pseudonocardia sp.]ODV04131.1 MAG: hypothetical protein ABT15_21380 [Pseudonocardia sp. SCN 73-27]
MTVTHEPATSAAADEVAVRQIIADVETGMNTNDPELMTRHFAADAVAVGVNGVPHVGRAALDAAHVAAVGPGGFLQDQYARYEVVDVRFVRPDVALVRKHAHAITADGEPLDLDHTMSALYVLTKDEGRWWIAARQNTLVAT